VGPVILAWGTALSLGILTSISPCPLATNIAAVSFIGQRVGSPLRAFLAGVLYALGRALTYVAVAAVVLMGLTSKSAVSQALQEYMNKLLGPILILVGMFLLELLSWPTSGRGLSDRMQQRVRSSGIWGAALLGILFALSFCPISAGLFFGSLIPLCLEQQSYLLLPALYGLGTALPALAFALMIAFGAHWVGKAFDRTIVFERWARRVTGVLFIGIGIYFTLVYIFEI